MKKIIIFDFDGTILDSLSIVMEITNSLAAKYKFNPIGNEDLAFLRGKTILEGLKILHISLFKLPKITAEVLNKIKKAFYEINLQPGIKEVLLKLHTEGYRLGIVSSNKKETIKKYLIKHDVCDYIDFIFQSKDLFGKDKVLKKLLKKFKLSKDECIYVGDEVRDVLACRKIDLDVIGVSWGVNNHEALEKVKPDFLIDTPANILAVLHSSISH